MIRRFGERLVRDQRYKHRPSAYAVLLRGRDVLLTHQAEPEPEYQLPGGGIDHGESPVHALHREAFEETGWSITGLRRIGAFRRFAYMPEYDLWAEKVGAVYLARPVRRIGSPSEPGHRAVWMPVEDAMDHLANASDRHFLLRALTL
jgi:8-oxo-dGTP diphosphatase